MCVLRDLFLARNAPDGKCSIYAGLLSTGGLDGIVARRGFLII
jgi:hypothetical protein